MIPTQGATLAVTAPSATEGGLSSETSAVPVAFDLTAWAGLWVLLTSEGTPHYYLTAEDDTATIDPDAEHTDAATADPTIPGSLPAGASTPFVVQPSEPFLIVRTAGDEGRVRVHLAQPPPAE